MDIELFTRAWDDYTAEDITHPAYVMFPYVEGIEWEFGNVCYVLINNDNAMDSSSILSQ